MASVIRGKIPFPSLRSKASLCILAAFMLLTMENIYAEGTNKPSDSSLRVELLGKIERENLLDDNNYSEAKVPPSNASKKRVHPFAELLGLPSSNSEFRSPPNFAYGIKLLLLGAIKFHQAVITKQDGPSCKASPTCSEWGLEKVKRHHVWGVVLIASRLLRCYRCQETGCALNSYMG